jgi:hypothetical protein
MHTFLALAFMLELTWTLKAAADRMALDSAKRATAAPKAVRPHRRRPSACAARFAQVTIGQQGQDHTCLAKLASLACCPLARADVGQASIASVPVTVLPAGSAWLRGLPMQETLDFLWDAVL